VGVIALIVLGFFCKRRMNNLNEDHGTRMNEMIDLHSKDIEHVLNPLEQSQFTVDPSELHLGKRIGQGGCGFIYKATLGANTIVAAKEIITVAIDPEDIAEFEHEARMLTQMNHPNVLRVLGFCTKPAEQCEDNQEHKYIITEFAPNGSLENIIMEAEKKAKEFKEAGVRIHEASMPFTKIQALEWALQTASGMLYLHSRGFMRKILLFVLQGVFLFDAVLLFI
jgi:serine/threonine protein kinase